MLAVAAGVGKVGRESAIAPEGRQTQLRSIAPPGLSLDSGAGDDG